MSERLDKNSLYFLPLGGVNEIGMNLNLYGYGDQWLMVDLGTSFADEGMPGVDMVVPDVTWIAGRRKKLLGIVLTHAHEDHLGAISHLWDELQCPIWATGRSEEHTSELQSLMRISYAVFCLKKKQKQHTNEPHT